MITWWSLAGRFILLCKCSWPDDQGLKSTSADAKGTIIRNSPEAVCRRNDPMPLPDATRSTMDRNSRYRQCNIIVAAEVVQCVFPFPLLFWLFLVVSGLWSLRLRSVRTTPKGHWSVKYVWQLELPTTLGKVLGLIRDPKTYWRYYLNISAWSHYRRAESLRFLHLLSNKYTHSSA